MRIGSHDTDERVLVIAEIGNNHEGDFGRACEMVEAAVAAGADAVKFQTFRTEHYVSKANSARFEMLKRFELSYSDFAKLKLEADRHGVLFLSTPFDMESARFLNDLVPAFKIASGDNTFGPLLEQVAGYAKPILLSCGMLSQEEICKTADTIETVWRNLGVSPGLAMLHCVTSYPAPEHEINLSAMLPAANAIDAVPGYSDHTLGTEAAVLAVACGARIIEKHFTLDKQFSDFRDHQLSSDPEELAELIARIRRAELILGAQQKCLRNCERDVLPLVRRSAALACPLPAGTALRREDLTWVRPAGGFSPDAIQTLIGKRLAQDVDAYEILRPEMLEG